MWECKSAASSLHPKVNCWKHPTPGYRSSFNQSMSMTLFCLQLEITPSSAGVLCMDNVSHLYHQNPSFTEVSPLEWIARKSERPTEDYTKSSTIFCLVSVFSVRCVKKLNISFAGSMSVCPAFCVLGFLICWLSCRIPSIIVAVKMSVYSEILTLWVPLCGLH